MAAEPVITVITPRVTRRRGGAVPGLMVTVQGLMATVQGLMVTVLGLIIVTGVTRVTGALLLARDPA